MSPITSLLVSSRPTHTVQGTPYCVAEVWGWRWVLKIGEARARCGPRCVASLCASAGSKPAEMGPKLEIEAPVCTLYVLGPSRHVSKRPLDCIASLVVSEGLRAVSGCLLSVSGAACGSHAYLMGSLGLISSHAHARVPMCVGLPRYVVLSPPCSVAFFLDGVLSLLRSFTESLFAFLRSLCFTYSSG